jgi:hypothetical protein
MARSCCLLVLGGILFVAAAADAQTEGGSRTETSGNSWFNLKPVENPWNIGIYGGYANNTLYQGGAENSRPGKTWESGHGWTIGIPVRFQIFNWLAVQAEAVFITKNYSYHHRYRSSGAYNYTANSFVELPLLASLWVRIPKIPELRLYINGGNFIGVWVDSHEKGRNLDVISASTYGYSEKYEFDGRRDNRFEYGLAGGAGIQYETRLADVFLEWRYNYGLSDLQKPYQRDLPPQINDTWTLQLGLFVNPRKIMAKKIGDKK